MIEKIIDLEKQNSQMFEQIFETLHNQFRLNRIIMERLELLEKMVYGDENISE